ncbi:hypothetical protein [Maribacter sp. 2308TA10-17]|uniref:hypothetical protein n=1 Tax=Maribacter sp. 2308TA10-17 TaxID=3386276 RepID=UPI0039BCE6EC
MKKLLSIGISTFMLFSCSTDKIDALEEAIDNTIELPDEEKAPDENPVDDTEAGYFTDSFDTEGDLIDYVTNNAAALPNVSSVDGRYKAVLDDNTNNITLHFHEDQGRIDAKLVTFPFEFIARNIGIGTLADSQTAPSPNGNPYLFSGVQVHHKDFNSINSTHVVVGHRGGAEFTIEGKNTVDGSSSVNDIGANTAPAGRADIRIVGTEERELIIYWQTPNLDYETVEDTWNLYRDTGDLPGATPAYGEEVYVGLITYAYGQTGVPFVGTCDAIEIRD